MVRKEREKERGLSTGFLRGQDRYVGSRSNKCSRSMSPLLRSRLYLGGIEGSLSQLRSAACQLRLSATSLTETNIITDA